MIMDPYHHSQKNYVNWWVAFFRAYFCSAWVQPVAICGLALNTKARVVVGSGTSNEFQVNIGLRQGSALSPLPFI